MRERREIDFYESERVEEVDRLGDEPVSTFPRTRIALGFSPSFSIAFSTYRVFCVSCMFKETPMPFSLSLASPHLLIFRVAKRFCWANIIFVNVPRVTETFQETCDVSLKHFHARDPRTLTIITHVHSRVAEIKFRPNIVCKKVYTVHNFHRLFCPGNPTFDHLKSVAKIEDIRQHDESTSILKHAE